MIVAVDTSVVVAALLSWHEHNEPATRALNVLLRQGTLVIPQYVIIESYSVLTRLRVPHRIDPVDAHHMLSSTFRGVPIASMGVRAVWPLIESLAAESLGGGIVYDAAIARAALDAKAEAILTFNVRDFERVAGGMRILEPE